MTPFWAVKNGEIGLWILLKGRSTVNTSSAKLVSLGTPALFVVLWSTGFIGAKYGLPYAEPFTLLFYRFLLTLVVLVGVVWYTKPPRIGGRACLHLTVSGSLIHGAYLGGLFSAIAAGMSPAVCALVVGLQPLLTTALAPLVFNRHVPLVNWMGIILGLFGVAVTLTPSITSVGANVPALTAAIVALLGITAGTIYQKKYCTDAPLLSGTLVQYLGATVLFGFASSLFETGKVDVTVPLVLTVTWLALGLSVGAILLLFYLIKHGESHKVASLFFLVPSVTALEAFYLFDEVFGLLKVLGFVLAAIGLALATKDIAIPRRTQS